MSSARSFAPQPDPRAAHVIDGDLAHLELSGEERIGTPPPSSARRVIRRLVVLTTLLGATWLVVDNRETAEALWSLTQSTAARMIETAARPSTTENSSVPRPAAPEADAGTLQPLAEDSAKAESQVPASELATGSLPPSETTEDDAVAQPSARAAVTDPLQRRAQAAGLHPDLSRALLERLSAADYRNAGIAIATALAQTPDDGELTFPPKAAPGRAQFRVHFAPGAAGTCRRYIVTIAASGWLTTALPMEKCGVVRRSAGAQ